jgi:ribosome-binding factor A
MGKPNRMLRINELLKEEISKIVMYKLKDPRVGFVTITKVETSPDLREAKIFVSIMGEQPQKEENLRGLERASGFIRNELRRNIRLKGIPRINFILDTSIDYSMHINKIINSLKKR